MARERRVTCWRKRNCRCRSVFLAWIVAIVPVAAFSQSQNSVFVQRPESELLLLALRIGGETLDEAFPAYPLNKSVIVPLGALSSELGFGIEVDVANATADGFFIAESRRFHLDAKTATVTIEGRQMRFDRSSVEVHQDDI